MSFKVGQQVQVKASVKQPIHGWGAVKHGEVGSVTHVHKGELIVSFPSQRTWFADPQDVELASNPASKRKSPEKVLAYGVLNKEGKLVDITEDRDYARLLKAIEGGKKAGVTIVTLKAIKEIR